MARTNARRAVSPELVTNGNVEAIEALLAEDAVAPVMAPGDFLLGAHTNTRTLTHAHTLSHTYTKQCNTMSYDII